ncbi:CLUMA_CG020931, isoform A [Clunio marinus]|uniref:CLUMA_CG020931, isoform A n=1 Tax=Clunio marinus TaxID=568069 RepID=A0A1J1J783_9DIPT|nr:CLUMA_CG020931, isoform A [Clunio marinus]
MAVDIESVVNLCCNEGNEWGSQRKHCNEYKFNLDNNVVPAGLHGLCLSTVEICCAKQHRIYQCTAGSVAAKSSSSCDNTADNYGTEFFKDCCEACKIGLVIGSTSPQCSTDGFSFGSPWDDIIEDCCSDIRDGDGEEILDDSKKFQVTISQI